MAYLTNIVRTTSHVMLKCTHLRFAACKLCSPHKMLHHTSAMYCSGSRTFAANRQHKPDINLMENDITKDKMIQKDPEMDKGMDFDQLKQDASWTESFGTLAGDVPEYKDIELEQKTFPDDENEDDSFEEPYRRLSKVGRQHTPNWYGRQIEKLAKQGKIYECINMLEVKMLKEDRVMPNEYVFTVLIGALGRVGYTRKAFKLYRKMMEYRLKPEDPTYTALFNACSNCPWPEYGLRNAKILKEKMAEKLHQPNQITYKAMIKAFGRCGDIVTAFSIVDEMIEAHLRIDNEVFSMLLQACISDRDAGLRHAIQVWHRINKLKKKKKITPEIYQYNLFLRAVRDCGIGDPVLAQQLMASGLTNLLSDGSQNANLLDAVVKTTDEQHEMSDGDLNRTDKLLQKENIIEIKPVEDVEELSEPVIEQAQEINVTAKSWWAYDSEKQKSTLHSLQMSNLSVIEKHEQNLTTEESHSGAVQVNNNLDTPEKRLALFGGFSTVLASMEQDNVRPDIRTFTQLIEMIPSDLKAEQELLLALEKSNVKPDVDFFNMLIRKRNLRRDYESAKEVLVLLAKNNLKPNNFTFGCLAMGCPKRKDGMQLIEDMENAGFNLSVEICNILIKQSRMNFIYKMLLLQKMKELDIKPNEITLRTIERHVKTGRDAVIAQEKGLPVKWRMPTNFSEHFGVFMKYYKSWLLSMDLEKEPHPWEQFTKPTPETDNESD